MSSRFYSRGFGDAQKMRLLVIADARIPVPPVTYGGAERIVGFLCERLQRRGHFVRLMATSGSRDYGGGVIRHRPPGDSYPSRGYRKLSFCARSVLALSGIDVVINFGRIDYLEAILRTRMPVLVCFQNPVDQNEIDWVLHRRRRGIRFVGVSKSQVAGLGPSHLIDVVPNAADTEALRELDQGTPHSYLAFVGRLTHNKGADTAISVACRSGWPLKLAGPIATREAEGQDFFERRIRPALNKNVEYVGEINDLQKREVLGGAAALLFPVRWPEPFGIVMTEALACGTPVIATRCAATPEVIEQGETGFLCDSEDEMIAAVQQIEKIDRGHCRRVAEERFSPEALVAGYLHSIEKLLAD